MDAALAPYKESPDLWPNVVAAYTSSQFILFKQMGLQIDALLQKGEQLDVNDRMILKALVDDYNKRAPGVLKANPDVFKFPGLPVGYSMDQINNTPIPTPFGAAK
jgi:hypothetical protein